jgi:hypothetical protein
MGIAVFRDISLLWLIFLTLIAILPFGVIFFLIIQGLHRLRQAAKKYLPIAQEKAQMVADKTDEISQKIASPAISAHAKAAQIDGVTRAILSRRKKA